MNDADIEMMEWERMGNTMSAYARKYGCSHGSLQWLACTECGRIFASDQEWYDVLDCITQGLWDETGDVTCDTD